MTLDTPRMRRLLAAIIVVAGLIFASTVPLEQRISAPFILEPAAVWTLSHDGNGQVAGSWRRGLLGNKGGVFIACFDRPDVIRVDPATNIREGSTVQIGDTLTFIYSTLTDNQIEIYQAALQKAQAQLTALQTGARTEDVEVARRKLEAAQSAGDSFRPEWERAQIQWESGLISASEWETTDANRLRLENDASVAAAQLASLQTGARPADIRVGESESERLTREIKGWEQTVSEFRTITSPLSGVVHVGGMTGEILSVEKTDTLMARILAPSGIVGLIAPSTPVVLEPDADLNYALQVFTIGGDFSADSTGLATVWAITPNPEGFLKSGMKGTARLNAGKMTLWQGLRRRLGS
ncbi:MAG: hypothetical protein V2A61_02225 [Calditrichota bacterium]